MFSMTILKHMCNLKALANKTVLNFEISVETVMKEVIWSHQVTLDVYLVIMLHMFRNHRIQPC